MKVKAQTYQHQTKQEWDINKEDMDIFEQIFFTEVRLGIAHHMKKKDKRDKTWWNLYKAVKQKETDISIYDIKALSEFAKAFLEVEKFRLKKNGSYTKENFRRNFVAINVVEAYLIDELKEKRR